MAPMMMSPAPSERSASPSTPAGQDTPHVPNEPIAICGMACRLPGESYTPSAFWDLLANKRSGQCGVPASRFNVDGFYHPDGMDRPGSVITRGGYFLDGLDLHAFENSLFGINNLEAAYMDPQQRKLLEVVFECLESAGVPLERASGSNTGVYVGNFTVDWIIMQSKDADYLHRFSATGMGTTILGNRVSHVFNLQGPSFVLDTACSSSLYCLHVACVALQNRECDAAIVAGSNLIQSAEQHLGTMKAGVLSPTSTCHTFDASADGYGRGEGVGALYVKRLSDAIRDGDPIRSVVRASAINANGKTAGISLPSADGQEAVIRKAIAKGGLHPDDVTWVECHGTGTKVGDAIEVEALSRVFQRNLRPGQAPLMIGAVKTNVGHSEAASGIAGVIKATLAIERGLIPPTFGLQEINPKLKAEERNISIPVELTVWPDRPGKTRRVGINSFGYGGANAHAIVEEAPRLARGAGFANDAVRQLRSFVTQSAVVLPLSAASQVSLDARVADLAAFDWASIDVLDLAHTLGSRRTNMATRGFLVASRADDIGTTFASKPLVQLGGAAGPSGGHLPFAFVFTGQGSQWPGMCRELFTEFPVFRAAVAEMDAVLQSIPGAPEWSLREAILDDANPQLIHQPQRSQPCCTAIQVALLQLLASWGIVPATTVGHSSGEIAAAFAAGHLTAAEAIVIAYYRGYCVARGNGLAQAGAMMAAGVSEEAAVAEIKAQALDGQIRVACVNSPEGVTISGDAPAIDALLEVLSARGTFARKLKTGGQAYHSHHMLAYGDQYQNLLDGVLPTLGPSVRLPAGAVMMSSVDVAPKSSGFDGRYWRSNLESQVRFSPAIAELHKLGEHYFIELGPHSSLELPTKQTLAKAGMPANKVKYAAPIRRNTDALESALGLAGTLWLDGYAVSWAKVNGLQQNQWKASASLFRVLTDLPPYRYNYEANTLMPESRACKEYRQRTHPRHELLGTLMPGGNGDDLIFRNILRAGDIVWLKDHRLEESVVVPGAAYMATVMEAAMRATGIDRAARPTFHFSGLNIPNALILSTETTAETEVFTSLRRTPITNVGSSAAWWDFSFSSYQDGVSVPHAKGSISVTAVDAAGRTELQAKYQAPAGALESSHKRTWYEKLAKEGLVFGPTFQSITEFAVPRMKDSGWASAKAPVLTACGDRLAVYPIHPITIDAMFQTALVATARGVPKDLRAKMPTRIASATFHTAVEDDVPADALCDINSLSLSVGFGSTLSGGEIVAPDGRIVGQFDGLRTAPYSRGQTEPEDRRHPILRVLWKPDVAGLGYMSPEAAGAHLQQFADEAHSPVGSDEGLLKMGAMLDLILHKDPRMNILELGNDVHDITVAVLDLLGAQTDFKRMASYTTASFADDGSLVGGPVNAETGERASKVAAVEQDKFDLILMPVVGSWTAATLNRVKAQLADHATILALCPAESEMAKAFASSDDLSVLSVPIAGGKASVVVARQPTKSNTAALQKHKFLIVERDGKQTKLGSAIAEVLQQAVQAQPGVVARVSLAELTAEHVAAGPTVFNLAELHEPLLSTVSDADMAQIKLMTDGAQNLVWATGGNTMQGARPDFSLVSGLARALVLEQPSLKFYVYDVDEPEADVEATARRFVAVLNQQSRTPDLEFVQSKGVLHVSRFVPDHDVNAQFRAKQGLEMTEMAVAEAGAARLSIESAGQFDTLFWQQQEEEEAPGAAIGPDEVRIRVASVGLNAKDFYVLAGRVDTPGATCQLECAGTVVQVGSAVTRFAPADRIVVMAPTKFQTYLTLPEWACYKLKDDEKFDVAATLPVVYSTALYALNDRARIQPGETVLVHSGAGGVGIAVIQLAKLAGAEVFTTVSTEEKKRYLVESFGVKESNIFSSRDTSFLDGIMKATSGRGVDIIINSLTGDQLHATWRCAAQFGRFVEIGKLDLTNSGRLEMDQFLKNTTFTAFDLSYLYNTGNAGHHALWQRLLSETMQLFRAGKIAAFEPLSVFDVSEATKAFRYFSSRSRMGKIAINLETGESKIRVAQLKHKTRFDPSRSYIMVGCLGGLGRTFSRWMLQRGAKKFVFLGRSGIKKAAARNLVEDLRASGAECTVVTGDVCNAEDVQAVVDATTGDIGGVVQAAMGLNEALFSSMSNEYWHTGIDPKVHGTWHLHRALRASGRDGKLDFFLMTSSISGSVGTATESNYCAANHFLDMFARYRRSQGLAATSIGFGMISEVGYLHDNPEIEALLVRKGIQSIDADELVQITDLGLSESGPADGPWALAHAHDKAAAGHMLTGLEAFGLKELRRKGFEGNNPAADDPRASLLANALDGDGDAMRHAQVGNLPGEVAQAMEQGMALDEAVLDHIRRRFGNLVLMKYEAVDVRKPLAEYGMDSMIAAEFRTWFWQSMAVDVPVLLLLGKTCHLEALRDLAVAEVEKSNAE